MLEYKPSEGEEASILAGAGFLGFAYPGLLTHTGGFGRFRDTVADQPGFSMPPLVGMFEDKTLDECRDVCEKRSIVGALHCAWVAHEPVPGALSTIRVGDCGVFLATRSILQATMWRGYFAYANHVLDLAHVQNLEVDDIATTILQVQIASHDKCEATGDVCMFWHEFRNDMRCFPAQDLSNVLLPESILLSVANSSLSYPPPPPAATLKIALPPSSPGSSDFKCYFEAVPQTTNTAEHIPCFLWCAPCRPASQPARVTRWRRAAGTRSTPGRSTSRTATPTWRTRAVKSATESCSGTRASTSRATEAAPALTTCPTTGARKR
jgi:hypothetical protein